MEIRFNYTTYPLPGLPPRNRGLFPGFGSRVAYTFSGKSALALVLRYYRCAGELKDKNDQVLVPPWLGSWVTMTIQHYAFPTLTMNGGVKGLMVYHQWGFPQKMEKIEAFCRRRGLFCIEDCAHAFSSSYRGRRVGTFGDASIWSLSKFFPSVIGGAIYSKRKDMLRFVAREQRKHDARLEKESFKQRARYDKRPDMKNSIELEKHYAIYPRLLRCPEYSLQVVARELAAGALQKRKANFELLRDAFWGKREKQLITDSDVTPWVAPLFFGSKNREVARALAANGVESGVYHFDVNRNMLEPDLKECVPIPCHDRISGKQMSALIDIVRKVA